MVELSLIINSKITEILRIDKKGLCEEYYTKGLCFGMDEHNKYLVLAVKRCRLICALLNYEEILTLFPQRDINDPIEADYLEYYLDQKIVSLRFFNDESNSSKSFFLLNTTGFQLRFDTTGLIDLNNR